MKWSVIIINIYIFYTGHNTYADILGVFLIRHAQVLVVNSIRLMPYVGAAKIGYRAWSELPFKERGQDVDYLRFHMLYNLDDRTLYSFIDAYKGKLHKCSN